MKKYVKFKHVFLETVFFEAVSAISRIVFDKLARYFAKIFDIFVASIFSRII